MGNKGSSGSRSNAVCRSCRLPYNLFAPDGSACKHKWGAVVDGLRECSRCTMTDLGVCYDCVLADAKKGPRNQNRVSTTSANSNRADRERDFRSAAHVRRPSFSFSATSPSNTHTPATASNTYTTHTGTIAAGGGSYAHGRNGSGSSHTPHTPHTRNSSGSVTHNRNGSGSVTHNRNGSGSVVTHNRNGSGSVVAGGAPSAVGAAAASATVQAHSRNSSGSTTNGGGARAADVRRTPPLPVTRLSFAPATNAHGVVTEADTLAMMVGGLTATVTSSNGVRHSIIVAPDSAAAAARPNTLAVRKSPARVKRAMKGRTPPSQTRHANAAAAAAAAARAGATLGTPSGPASGAASPASIGANASAAGAASGAGSGGDAVGAVGEGPMKSPTLAYYRALARAAAEPPTPPSYNVDPRNPYDEPLTPVSEGGSEIPPSSPARAYAY